MLVLDERDLALVSAARTRRAAVAVESAALDRHHRVNANGDHVARSPKVDRFQATRAREAAHEIPQHGGTLRRPASRVRRCRRRFVDWLPRVRARLLESTAPPPFEGEVMLYRKSMLAIAAAIMLTGAGCASTTQSSTPAPASTAEAAPHSPAQIKAQGSKTY